MEKKEYPTYGELEEEISRLKKEREDFAKMNRGKIEELEKEKEEFYEEMDRLLVEKNKAELFVKHIEEHLKDMPELKDKRAYCKICNTDIDTIAEKARQKSVETKQA